ncbi:MAG: 3-isopropylmalate dehydrogenase [Actinobacteria bacterium]|nr:3-isopropylmalate dehydrogenase [Actinomycetota bacterium]
MTHRIGLIKGDGIGPEVVDEALKALDATGVSFEPVEFDLGARRYLATGEVLPDSVLDEIRTLDAVLLGAVGHPNVPPGVLERGLLLRLRFELDLYVNLRPVKLLAGAATPLAGKGPDDIDMVVVRENTEGAYIGEGGVLRPGTAVEVASQGSLNTRSGVERCVRYAFNVAGTRPRRHVTLCHKTNVLTYAGDLWMRTTREVAGEYPNVTFDYAHVDAACLYMVEQPERFDVIVTDNLFGDILTDLGAAIAGGMGLAASGNINPGKETPSVFEPVHGSAPDIAGKGLANPLAAVLSAGMMLDHLGEYAAALRVEAGVAGTLEKLAGAGGGTTAQTMKHSTQEIGDLVADHIAREA